MSTTIDSPMYFICVSHFVIFWGPGSGSRPKTGASGPAPFTPQIGPATLSKHARLSKLRAFAAFSALQSEGTKNLSECSSTQSFNDDLQKMTLPQDKVIWEHPHMDHLPIVGAPPTMPSYILPNPGHPGPLGRARMLLPAMRDNKSFA